MVFAVLATAAQGKYRVRAKADYVDPVNLWVCYALPPGSRNTAVLEAARAPLSNREQAEGERLEPHIRRPESERRTMQGRIDVLRKMASADRAKSVPVLLEETADLEAKMPEIAHLPRLWTSDVTPGKLAMLMAENDECMAVISDEGSLRHDPWKVLPRGSKSQPSPPVAFWKPCPR